MKRHSFRILITISRIASISLKIITNDPDDISKKDINYINKIMYSTKSFILLKESKELPKNPY